MQNNDIKVSLTIHGIEGSLSSRAKFYRKIPYTVTKQDVSITKLPKEVGNKVIKEGTKRHYDRLRNDVTQHLNLTTSTYDYMIGDNPPKKSILRLWKNLSKKKRLEYHLKEIMYDLKGVYFTYEVFED